MIYYNENDIINIKTEFNPSDNRAKHISTEYKIIKSDNDQLIYYDNDSENLLEKNIDFNSLNLDQDTSYSVYVKINGNYNISSEWSDPEIFTTAKPVGLESHDGIFYDSSFIQTKAQFDDYMINTLGATICNSSTYSYSNGYGFSFATGKASSNLQNNFNNAQIAIPLKYLPDTLTITYYGWCTSYMGIVQLILKTYDNTVYGIWYMSDAWNSSSEGWSFGWLGYSSGRGKYGQRTDTVPIKSKIPQDQWDLPCELRLFTGTYSGYGQSRQYIKYAKFNF